MDKLSISIEAILKAAQNCIASEDIVPITDKESECPTFPVHVFPPKMQEIIASLCKYENFNTDYLAGAMLTVLSAAMGNQWKASFKGTWTATPILFTVLVGDMSDGKSQPIRVAMKPLVQYDKECERAYNQQMRDYKEAIQLSVKERIERGYDENPHKPFDQSIIANNTTIENLITELYQNRRGKLLYADELSGFILNLSRYSKGTDETYWLELFNSGFIKYGRKSSDDRLYIRNPFVSVIGGIQPGILSTLYGGQRVANGFAGRFLKIYPNIVEMPAWSREDVPENILEDWEKIVNSVLLMTTYYDNNGDVIPKILTFSDEAKDILYNWKETNRKVWADTDENYIRGTCGKLETYLIRFCLIIQVTRHFCDGASIEVIDHLSAQYAVDLAEYFRAMDLRSYRASKKFPVDGVHQKLFEILPDTFATKNAIEIAISIGMSERTAKRFLANGISLNYLQKTKHGTYKKQQ